MSRKIHLLIIDPQNDFCDPKGSLFVDGAVEDSKRLSKMIKRLDKKIDDIHVTLDSHHVFDIAHPKFWVDSSGNHPAPFTPISKAQLDSGDWAASIPGLQEHAAKYVESLESTGRYGHFIWPEHCLIGTWGTSIQDGVVDALHHWCSAKSGRLVDYVTKGSNWKTEHFSAVRAEVPDPNDAGTQINANLIKALIEADDILIAGQALSHCVANTVRDIADNFGSDDYIKKLILLTDASSPVGDPDGNFKKIGEDFVSELTSRGMRTSTTEDYLK